MLFYFYETVRGIVLMYDLRQSKLLKFANHHSDDLFSAVIKLICVETLSQMI